MASVPATLIRLTSQPHDGAPSETDVGGVLEKGEGGKAQPWSTLATTRIEEQLQCRLSPRQSIELPVELWWKVIDFVADHLSQRVDGRTRMRELARVSRSWYTWCRVRAEERLDVINRDKKEVYRLIRRLDDNPERYNAIKRVQFVNKKISNFGSFVIHLVGKLHKVETLDLKSRWRPSSPAFGSLGSCTHGPSCM
ncbi:uncharacterized protein FIBRA_08718 [Fibroporia radiculosa]|uniref:Uncharacterized protein n=1 Tax=Fibroporia radiculosa TaxID=599839 RepID=J4H5B6_9APHY|nr:uncharacterized protein FIBRA_08718 [Fibroporia radiculosa]CCM06454.1 predicted protein [Fibroporia radiculosa]